MTTIHTEPTPPGPGEQQFHLWGRGGPVIYCNAPTLVDAIEAAETQIGITVNFASGTIDVAGFDTLQDFLDSHRGTGGN